MEKKNFGGQDSTIAWKAQPAGKARAEHVLERIRRYRHAVKYMTELAFRYSFNASAEAQVIAPQYECNDKVVSNVIADIAHLRQLPPFLAPEPTAHGAAHKKAVPLMLSPSSSARLTDDAISPAKAEPALDHTSILQETLRATPNVVQTGMPKSVQTDAVCPVTVASACVYVEYEAAEALEYGILVKLLIPGCQPCNCRCDNARHCFCGCDHNAFIIGKTTTGYKPFDLESVEVFYRPKREFDRRFVTYERMKIDSGIDIVLEQFPQLGLQIKPLAAEANSWADLVTEAQMLFCRGK